MKIYLNINDVDNDEYSDDEYSFNSFYYYDDDSIDEDNGNTTKFHDKDTNKQTYIEDSDSAPISDSDNSKTETEELVSEKFSL